MPRKPKQVLYCDVCGASSEEKEVKFSRKYNMALCSKHRHHLDRHGKILERTSWDSNDYILYDNYAEIILRNRKHEEVGRTIIDLDDIEKCKEQTWRLTYNKKEKGGLPNVSCMTRIENKNTSISRYLLNYTGPLVVDHINRNRLDNRKENLRIVDQYTNMANNKYDNVRIQNNGYVANIRRHNVTYFLGRYKTYEEALNIAQKAKKDYEYDPSSFELKPYIKSKRRCSTKKGIKSNE